MLETMQQITTIFATLTLGGAVALAQPEPPRPPAPPRQVRVITQSPASFLGVGVAEIDAERVKALNLKEERGVEVKSVDADSPAAKAGVKVNDVILEYNGQRVEGDEQFVRLVRETPVGRQVKLLISRNGATQTLTATLGSRPGNSIVWNWNGDDMMSHMRSQMRELNLPDLPHQLMSWQNRTLGMESESLNSQLAEYFGVKEGVLVRSVTKGTAADKAGFKAGDVITKIGNQKVAAPKDVHNALRSLQSTKGFPVTVSRDRKEMTLTVTIEEKSSEHIHTDTLVRMNL
jgi:serine protease Do